MIKGTNWLQSGAGVEDSAAYCSSCPHSVEPGPCLLDEGGGFDQHVLRFTCFACLCILCLDGLAKKFGLTPEQFGENLRDSYQRHETEQFPAEPLELAKDYVCRSVPPRMVLLGCVGTDGIRRSQSCDLALLLLSVNSRPLRPCWKEPATWWHCR